MGLIRFADVAAAEKALSEFNGKEIDGYNIILRFSKGGGIQARSRAISSLFVSNLSIDTEAYSLEKLIPDATKIILPKDSNGVSKR